MGLNSADRPRTIDEMNARTAVLERERRGKVVCLQFV